ncbi:hypothetical protein NDN08_001211 [Rhodosorus marinus]|uniref:Signal sequence receptor subunit alpha n=1 Tax=Rhodosorus marinus TaxID=101924 RepID=A0AAV8USX7_9RHOD|nr:hypothetical protein NDN08_001211 [Rhodosorus marinus]
MKFLLLSVCGLLWVGGAVCDEAVSNAGSFLAGNWDLRTNSIDGKGMSDGVGSPSRLVIYSSALEEDHTGQLRGKLIVSEDDEGNRRERPVKLLFRSEFQGDLLLGDTVAVQETGENSSEREGDDFQKIFSFQFHSSTSSSWISQGEWRDGSNAGVYTFQITSLGVGFLTRTHSDGTVETISIETKALPALPDSFLKKYGMSAVMIVTFVGSKLFRNYMMAKPQRGGAGPAAAAAAAKSK